MLQATLAAYRLPAPLSRAVVFNAGSDLLVAGGLTAGSSSASGVFRLDPTTGTLTSDGRLAAPVHDAAGVTLDGGNLVLGGGAQATTANVQRLRDGGTAQLIGRLPQPRSDLVAATVGQAAYVLGGYDGATTLAFLGVANSDVDLEFLLTFGCFESRLLTGPHLAPNLDAQGIHVA